jgi:diketogulonate reductase-like aldo/keto reductase
VDTAAAYGNEREVGEAIARSGVNRSDVVVETKIWINDYGYDTTLHGFEKSAKKLGAEQIDLLIRVATAAHGILVIVPFREPPSSVGGPGPATA